MLATLKHNDKLETMYFDLNSKEYAVMVEESNHVDRVFLDHSSLAHQIYGCQINSAEHEKMTVELRENSVKHIQTNFEKYKQYLNGRVYEQSKNPIDPRNSDSECRIFSNACLARSNCYGGIESIVAISHMMEINIIFISENGDGHMSTDFKSNFQRTVF